ncbi:MAG TPA: hypothetical protein VK886_04495 [Vicinamibacterales bacterium]|nr:hypothetical protein [Vicinamibacterales bacterium]
MDQLLNIDPAIWGELRVPPSPQGLVLVMDSVEGDAAAALATILHLASFATFRLDQVCATPTAPAVHVRNLTNLLLAAAEWVEGRPELNGLPVGLFGAHAGGGAALAAAARRPDAFRAVVSRAGLPHLSGAALDGVRAATLLIADRQDHSSVAFGQEAMARVAGIAELEILPGAPSTYDDAGTAAHVAHLARRWFTRFLP